MAADSLTIGVRADTSKLRADLAIAKVEVRQLGSELSAAAKEAQKTGDRKALEDIAGRYDAAAAHANELGAAVKAVGQEHKNLRAHLAEAGEALKGVRENFSKLRESISRLVDNVFPRLKEALTLSLAAASAEFAHLAIEAASAVRETENQAHALGYTTDAFEALRLVAARAGVDQDEFSQSMARFAQAGGKAREAAAKLTGQMPGAVAVLRGGMAGAAGGVAVLRGGVHELANSIAGSVNVLRGAGQQIPDFSDPFKALGIDINRFADDAKGHQQLLVEIAKRLNAMGDSAIKASIGQRFFGRSWREVVPAFVDLGKRLEEAQKKIEASGLGMQEYERRQAQTFNSSLAVMQFYVDRVKEIIGLGLGQSFLPVFNEIEKELIKNSGGIRQWANQTGQYLADVARDFIDMIKGAGSDKLRTNFAKNFVFAKDLIVAAIPVIKSALHGLLDLFDGLAVVINTVDFGLTNFSGASLGVTLALAQMSGLLSVVVLAVRALIAIFAALVAVVGLPWALLIVAVAAAAVAIYAFRDKIAVGLVWLWEHVKTVAIAAWKAISAGAKVLGTDLLAVGNSIASPFVAAFDAITTAFENLVELISVGVDKVYGAIKAVASAIASAAQAAASFLGSAGSSLAAGAANGAAPGFAGGGKVRGAGTSTSDSIPARLSHGEYVVKAAAVSHYGSGFMDAVNSMRAGAGHAMGGLVHALAIAPTAAPLAFAAGGLAGGGGHAARAGGATIHLTVGGETFHGLSAPDHVATQMQRFARGRQMTAAGTKPSWYGS